MRMIDDDMMTCVCDAETFVVTANVRTMLTNCSTVTVWTFIVDSACSCRSMSTFRLSVPQHSSWATLGFLWGSLPNRWAIWICDDSIKITYRASLLTYTVRQTLTHDWSHNLLCRGNCLADGTGDIIENW